MAARDVPFALVDVFTDVPLAGNPLAVVPDAAGLAEALLPAIAREFNQSETTFLLPPTAAGADWRLRSFTPAGHEVFGAGHNALGAWWWLADAGPLALPRRQNAFHQELGGRVLPLIVHSQDGRPSAVAMSQSPAVYGATVEDRASLASALGLSLEDLPADLPAQVVSTGAPHFLVNVRPAALNRARPDSSTLRAILMAHGGQGCYLFALTPESAAHVAVTRFFNPVTGIAEDPATGSAAGPLACYLVRRGLATGDRVRFAQGAATGRPSQLEVRLRGDEVQLLGRGVVVAEGTLRGLQPHMPSAD